jgi:hypothetical protein
LQPALSDIGESIVILWNQFNSAQRLMVVGAGVGVYITVLSVKKVRLRLLVGQSLAARALPVQALALVIGVWEVHVRGSHRSHPWLFSSLGNMTMSWEHCTAAFLLPLPTSSSTTITNYNCLIFSAAIKRSR